jgi:biofilm PGA synthesis N-glycosyltransferase PgaC
LTLDLIIVVLLFIAYSSLILFYHQGWKSIPLYEPGNTEATLRITVVIPARNEEDNIGALLQRIVAQRYPSNLVEIIVVDDHSTDRTAEVAGSFEKVILLSLKEASINSYKKKAIETAIEKASGELIVTTDADCIPGENWLATLADFGKQKDAVFIAAPVVFTSDNSVLQQFQYYDFLILQGITGAAVYKKQLSMCNGANLAYKRKNFFEAGGFQGIDQIASGDDMLLMYKIANQHTDQVFYLKSQAAIVGTQPMKTWRQFINQRIRWASKATRYQDKRFIPVLLLVYIVNLSFLFLFIAGFWNSIYFTMLLVLWLLKAIVEYTFVWELSRFFRRRTFFSIFFLLQPIHILYTIISGLLGQVGKYEWKGRRVH